jgi:iron complex transport system substrate-binding protein
MKQSLLFAGIMLNVLAATAAAPVPTSSSAIGLATTAAGSPPTIGNAMPAAVELGATRVPVATATASSTTARASATPAAAVAPRAAPLVITDDTGKTVTLPAIPTRIVSLAPGATEMLFAAGAGKHVIATVEYSDEPPAAKQVPRIGDVVAIDMERLVALRPEVAVVWPGGGNPAQIEEISRMHIPLYRQQVNTLADIAGSLRRLGALAGTRDAAEQAAQKIETRLATLARTYGSSRHPSVLMEVWNHPFYTVGGTHLMSDALRICGARNVFGDLKELGPVIDVEAVVARDPDIIVAAAPPGAGAEWLADWKRFTTLRAVRTGNLIAFEDQRLTRLGPSVVDATEALCKALAKAQ